MISIVIPVYNKFEALKILIPKLEIVLTDCVTDYEILLVDDGSDEKLYDFLKMNNLLKKNICLVELNKNYGQVPAIHTGLSLMKGDAAIIMASDLQEPLGVIPEFYNKWKSGHDLVIGKRINDTFPLSSRLFYFFYRIRNNSFPKGGYDYGLIDKSIIDKVVQISPFSLFLQQVFIDNSIYVGYIDYYKNKSFYRESSWSLYKRVAYAFGAIFNRVNFFNFFILQKKSNPKYFLYNDKAD